MKKHVKIAFSLLIVGILLIAAGFAMNGGTSFPHTVEQIPFVGPLFSDTDVSDADSKGTQTVTLNEQNFDFTEVESLSLDMDAAAIQMQTGEQWEIRYSSNCSELQTKQKNGVLTLEQKAFRRFNDKPSKLTVTIPQRTILRTLELDLDACNLTLSDALETEHFSLDGDAAKAAVSNLTAQTIALDGDAADIDLQVLFTGKKCSIDGDASSIQVDFAEGSNLGEMYVSSDASSVTVNGEKFSDKHAHHGRGDGVVNIDADASAVRLTVPKN